MTAPVMLITGGSRGIGAATARLAAQQGYDVALTYKQDKTAAEKVAAEIRAKGRKALVIQADAANEQDAVRTFAEVKREFGTLDVLVYNAGVSGKEYRLVDAPTANIRAALDVNTFGCIMHAREAVKILASNASSFVTGTEVIVAGGR